MGIEISILNWIQTLRTPLGDWLMPLITSLGDGGLVWILMTILLLIFPKTRKVGLVVMIGLVLEAVLCNLVLKPITARIRPYDVNTSIKLLIDPQWDYSFPSGHTAASFAAASGLWFMMEKKCFAWMAILLASLIAFSRLYLYVHYPTDVVAGIVIGIASAWCAVRILPWLIQKVKK